jgi:hypothetical protein
MKTTCLLFLTINCAALMHGRGYAAPSNPASQQTSPQSAAKTVSDDPRDGEHAAPADDGKHQKDGKPSDEQRGHRHASDKNHPRSRASLTKANRPKQVPNNRERSTSGNAMNLHQPGSAKSGGAAKDGLMQNETLNNALPVRPPTVVRPTVPLRTNVRHRSANPAVIGGSATSDRRNTVAINGTHMNRRP